MVVHRRRLIAAWLEPMSIVFALGVAVAGPAPSVLAGEVIAANAAQHGEPVRVADAAEATGIVDAADDRAIRRSAGEALTAFEVARYRNASPATADATAPSFSLGGLAPRRHGRAEAIAR